MIQVGDRVRSFDFADTFEDGTQYGRDLEGERACYVEGVVVGFDNIEGCDRYRILVDRDVFGGKDDDRRIGRLVTPPINGTPKLFGSGTDFVESIS